MIYYIGQIIGIAALTFEVIAYQQRSQHAILLCQFAAATLFTVHFFMIGAYVGGLLNFIAIFRAIVFANCGKKWADSAVWLYVFIGLFAIAGIATLDGDVNILTWNINFRSLSTYIGLLPIVAMTLTTIAYRMTNAAKVRLVSLPASPCWFTYNLYNHSWAGVCTELMLSASIITAMIRLDFRRDVINDGAKTIR